MKVSIIITLRNEETIIEKNLIELYNFLEKNFEDFEILVWDDSSTDKTPYILDKISKRYPKIRIFLSKKKIGKGWSIIYLIKKAKFDKIIFIDADLPTDLKNIIKVARLLEKYDIVVGVRTNRENLFRWFLSKIYNFLVNIFLFLDIPDIQTGFKAFNKEKVIDIKILENHWNWDTEFLIKAKEKGLKIGKVFINWFNIRKSHIKFLTIFYMFRRLLSIISRFYFSFFKLKIVRDYINEKLGIFLFKLFGFFLTIALTRILGPNGYGIYVIVLSLAFLIASFSDFGVPIAIIKFLGENINNKVKQSIYFRFLLRILIIVNLLSVIIIFFISKNLASIFLKNESFYIFVIISSLIAFAVAVNSSFKSVFNTFKRFDILRNISFLEGLLKLIIIIPLAFILGYLGSILGFLLTYLILVFISLFLIKTYFPHLLEKAKNNIATKKIIKYLALINLSTAARSLYGWLDSLIIGSLLDPKSVAYYKVSNVLVALACSFTGLQAVFIPRFASWDVKKIKRILPKIFFVNLLISFIAFFFIRILRNYIILFIYGESFLPASDLLKVGSYIILLNSFAYFLPIFNLKGKPHYTSLIIGLSAIVNAVFDYILIIKIGLIGAIWASIIAWIFSLCIGTFLFYKTFKD